MALGLVEQVAHAAGAHADEHLDELRAGDGEERHAGLARNGLGHQRLARARGADQQHALGDASPQRDELLRFLEELDDLLQLFLRFLDARHVREGDRGLVAGEHAGARLAEGDGLVVGALRLAQHEEDQADHQQAGQQVGDDADDRVPVARLLDLDLQLLRGKGISRQPEVDQLFDGGLGGFLAREGARAVAEDDFQVVLVDDDARDAAGGDLRSHLVQVQALGLGGAGAELNHQDGDNRQQDDEDQGIATPR